MSMARSGCGPRPARACDAWSPGWSAPTPGPPTRTSGSTCRTTPAWSSAPTRRHTGPRWAYGPATSCTARDGQRDALDYNPEHSRRARGFAVYAAIRALGRSGIAEMVERCCAWLSRFAEQLTAADGVEVLNEVVLNQVLVRLHAPDGDHDGHTYRVLERLQHDGTCWMSGTSGRARRPYGSRCRTGRPTPMTSIARSPPCCVRTPPADPPMGEDELIGRERERALLASPIAEALAGHGSLILLAGEAGVGKTTLARRVLTGSGLTVLEGFATPGGASAFGPLVEVLRAHLRSMAGGPLIEGPLAAHLALLLPELGPAARGGDPATLFEAIRSGIGDDRGAAADRAVPRRPAVGRPRDPGTAARAGPNAARAAAAHDGCVSQRRATASASDPADAQRAASLWSPATGAARTARRGGHRGTGGPDSRVSRTDPAPSRVRPDRRHSACM